MSNTLANDAHQRSLKDFLTLYNTITEYCFTNCISNFNERRTSTDEVTCVDVCTDNYIQYNQRFMFNFVDHQERRKREQESIAIESAAKEAAAAQAAQVEQQAVSQEQMQKAAQMLETLSSPSSGLSRTEIPQSSVAVASPSSASPSVHTGNVDS